MSENLKGLIIYSPFFFRAYTQTFKLSPHPTLTFFPQSDLGILHTVCLISGYNHPVKLVYAAGMPCMAQVKRLKLSSIKSSQTTQMLSGKSCSFDSGALPSLVN